MLNATHYEIEQNLITAEATEGAEVEGLVF
jgi:hypothetical protein